MSGPRLDNWAARQRVSARKLQQPVEAIRDLYRRLGADVEGVPLPYENDPRWRLGKIVAAGPADEANYADERYWVRDAEIIAGASGAAQIVIDESPEWDPGDGGDPVVPIYTVTNLPELLTHTHDLPYGLPVLFRDEYDRPVPDPENEADGEFATPKAPLRRLVMIVPDMPGRPQYEGMGLFGVANNERGWTFTPSVDTLD